MKSPSIRVYVALVSLTAVVAVLFQDWASLSDLPSSALGGFTFIILFGILSEATALGFPGAKGASHSSITWLPLIACVLLFGPAAAVLLFAASAAVAELFIRRNESLRSAFNISQFVVATAFAGLLFSLVGGTALAGAGMEGSGSFDPQFVPFAVFATTFLFSNHLLVTGAIAVSEEKPLKKVLGTVLFRTLGVVSSFVCKMGSWGAGSSGPFSRDVVIPSFLLGCAGPSAEGTKVSPAHAASPSFSSDSL